MRVAIMITCVEEQRDFRVVHLEAQVV